MQKLLINNYFKLINLTTDKYYYLFFLQSIYV